MILDPRERLRFLEYCKVQADSCRAMAEQIEKLSTGVAATSVLASQEKQKAAAYALVAMDLASMKEDYVVGPEDIGEINDQSAD